jgi:hypothetical protein
MTRRRSRWLILTLVPVLIGACTNDQTTTQATSVDDLVAGLVTTTDLGDGWTVPSFPDGDLATIDGAVTDTQYDQLPRPELCDQASDASLDAMDSLRWRAFRAFELTVDDSIQPPSDRSGHLVFLQELLTTGPTDDLRTSFDLVREGFETCLGDIPASEEGPGSAVSMQVPPVGEDRFATLLTFEEAGGWAQWRIHQIMVLDGPVMMSLMIGEIRSMDVEPLLDSAQNDDLTITVTDALRS